MIALIQSRYEQVRLTTKTLEREHTKLEEANTRLNAEVVERRRAETALRENEQRFKIILDQLPIGTLIIDESTKIIRDANPAALKIIGMPLKKVIGSEFHQFIRHRQKGECDTIDLQMQIDKSNRMLVKAGGREVPILKYKLSHSTR